jgi:transposase
LQQKLQSLLAQDGGSVRRLEVLEGPTGRRGWLDPIKARIVAESFAPGARVSAVAARHRISPQQLTTWRRAAREGRLALPAEVGEMFAPLVIDPPTSAIVAPTGSMPLPVSAPGHVRWIEIVAGDVIVRLPEDASPARIGDIAARLRAS